MIMLSAIFIEKALKGKEMMGFAFIQMVNNFKRNLQSMFIMEEFLLLSSLVKDKSYRFEIPTNMI